MTKATLAATKYFWALITGIWVVLGLFMANQLHLAYARMGSPIPWGQSLAFEMAYSAQWILLAPLVWWLARRLPFATRRWPLSGAAHILAAVALSCLTMAIRHILSWIILDDMNGELTLAGIIRTSYTAMDYGIMSYFLILLVTYAFEYYTRYREREVRAAQLETQLIQAQLQTLKMQLQPHFLFNTLHTIANLVRTSENQTAIRMLNELSELLRYTLTTESEEIALRQELEILELYLRIQQVRFQDRLNVRVDVPEEVLDARVPNMLLQPLAENAIRHGFAPSARTGTVAVCAERENGMLHLWIRDDGVGLPNGEKPLRKGIGLSNTEARLERLYGTHQRFALRDDTPQGAVAEVWIPYHTEPSNGTK